MKFSIIISFLILSSCSSNWIKQNINDRSGTISYLNQGTDFIINQRKKDVESKIKSFCQSDYNIISESNHDHTYNYTYQLEEPVNYQSQSNGTIYNNLNYIQYNVNTTGTVYVKNEKTIPINQNYKYINFKCHDKNLFNNQNKYIDFNSCNQNCYENHSNNKNKLITCYDECLKNNK